MEDFIPLPEEKIIIPETSYYKLLGVNLHLAKDITGIVISDYDNSRIMHFSHSFNLLNSFGERGTGEGESQRAEAGATASEEKVTVTRHVGLILTEKHFRL